MLNPEGAYKQCAPYNTSSEFGYPNAVVEIYDLESDPEELVNLMDDPPPEADELKTSLCTWATESTWQTDETDERNKMLIDCNDILGNPPSKSR